jgi:hypothetical protein
MHSAIRLPLQLFGVASASHSDLCGGVVDLAEMIRGKFYGSRSDVLFDARQLGRAWDGNDPWLLCQQPGERIVSRSSYLQARNERPSSGSPIQLISCLFLSR